MSDRLDRIDAAEKKFLGKFGDMDDEWTETFDLACRFARRLEDTQDNELCERVVSWVEQAAECDDEGYRE